MCMMSRPKAPNPLAAQDSARATEQARLEARLRRRRAGAAADILTGPQGIPANTKMGQVA